MSPLVATPTVFAFFTGLAIGGVASGWHELFDTLSGAAKQPMLPPRRTSIRTITITETPIGMGPRGTPTNLAFLRGEGPGTREALR